MKTTSNKLITTTVAELKEFTKDILEDSIKTIRSELRDALEEKTYTAKEICEKFKISTVTLHRWGKNNILTPKKIGSRLVYYNTDVQQAIERNAARKPNINE